MSVLRCKMCGGNLNVTDGQTVCECEYCGTKQTVPALDNEKKAQLFARANKLRFGCEFDKASGIYETIITDYPEDAEAYWGLLLCKYGIEYVDDPKTGKKIPTCHRSSFDSIFDDSNFDIIMENSDALARNVYREEAKTIEEIRKGIIEVSSKEEPYDIFICYKETDENGNRTLDSVIAQDVYNALTEEKYKVFFSRITLEDKLGQEYEPYIFAALNSAKIMLVFGTNYENFNAVWVKNEWSRYLQLIEAGQKKYLIPCFKNIDAYDIPKEFRKLQAQDMGKVGAIQDLLRGIDKIAPLQKTEEKTVIVKESSTIDTTPLLKRAFMFLEEGKWKEADEYCEKVLDWNPECAEAYVGKLMAEIRVSNKNDLSEFDVPLDINENYEKACKYDKETEKWLSKINKSIREREESDFGKAEQTKKKSSRKISQNTKIKLIASIGAAIILFTAVTQYFLIPQYHYSTAVKAEKEYETSGSYWDYERAKNNFNACEDYKDSKEQLNYLQFLSALFTVDDDYYSTELFKDFTKTDKILEKVYTKASALFEKGKYDRAKFLFDYLEDYKDSESLDKECLIGSIGEENYKKIESCKVGDIIEFGNYYYSTEDEKEPVKWRVLDVKGSKALIISENIIDCVQYNYENSDVTWETCSLRSWLNDSFLTDTFNFCEQSIISESTATADRNPNYDTDPGNDTTDKIFILSMSEAGEYFSSDSDRMCIPTPYAATYVATQDVYISDSYEINGKKTCWWWLRTPGDTNEYISNVGFDGGICSIGNAQITGADVGVRPAMWIEIQ